MSADLLDQLGAVGTWLDDVAPVTAPEVVAAAGMGASVGVDVRDRDDLELEPDDDPGVTSMRDRSGTGPGRRPWVVAAAVAAAVAVVAGIAVSRSGDDADPPVDVVADSTTTAAATSTSADTSTTTADEPTTTTAAPAPPGLVVAPSDLGFGATVVALGDGFVSLDKELDEGPWTLRTSVDGLAWQDVPTDLPGDVTVQRMRSDGSRLVAVATVVGSDAMWAGTSADGGRTWTGAELTTPDLPQVEFVRWSHSNTEAAVGTDGYLVVGSMSSSIDHRALAIAQTGRDPGVGALYSGGGTQWTVEPEDGSAPITLDLSGIDPAYLDLGVTIPAAWVSDDGASWELLVEPFGPGRAPYTVVSGPDGFLATTQATRPGVEGEPGAEIVNALQRSVDGRTWDLAPLPDGMINLPWIAADRSRYLLLGEDRVLRTSTDGAAWTVLAALDMSARPGDGGGELEVGPAGIVVAGMAINGPASEPGDVVDEPVDPDSFVITGYATWSPDGVTWQPVDLPEGTAWASGAVSDEHVLVLNAPAG
jgi:hypothetical protein